MMMSSCARALRPTLFAAATACVSTQGLAQAVVSDFADLGDRPEKLRPVNMGINLAPIADWSSEWVFTDALRSSRPWIPQRPFTTTPWDTGEEIQTDDLGNPRPGANQAAATLMYRGIDGRYPTGTYVMTYEGTADIVIGMDAQVINQAPGRIEFVVDNPTDAGIYLQVASTDPADPIHDMHVWLPGFEDSDQQFHPAFLEKLRPFSTIRFMEWMETNNSTITSWDQRLLRRHLRQMGPGGVSLGIMIDLCNELNADPWFCMPHQADDEYVRRFAFKTLDKLDPELNVYIEYSNEVWNPQFQQFHWVEDRAIDSGIFQPHQTADEAKRDWDLWMEEWAGQEHRLVRVAAGQHRNPWVADQIMERLQGDADALSCAGYFAARQQDEPTFGAHTTADQIVASCRLEIQQGSIPFLQAHRNIIDRWQAVTGKPIRFHAYEGGQHLTAYGNGNLPHLQAYYDAQVHPVMSLAYRELFQGWNEVGGNVFMAFNSVGTNTRHGSWGHLEYQDQPVSEAPKYRALLDAIVGETTSDPIDLGGFGGSADSGADHNSDDDTDADPDNPDDGGDTRSPLDTGGNDGDNPGDGGSGDPNDDPLGDPAGRDPGALTPRLPAKLLPWMQVPEMRPVLERVFGETLSI